jgi:high affinity Mn2+ porin
VARRKFSFTVAAAAAVCLTSPLARAQATDASTDRSPEQAAPEDWAVHGQATFIEQYHPAFRSPYRGPNSLDPGSRGDETFDATLYLGARLWVGAEAWADPEIDQGFGLSNTLGIAGFPNAEGSKVGMEAPYPKLPRLFLRQTIGLGGGEEEVEPDANQLGGERSKDRLVATIGKFSVTDVFDTNAYSHDSKNSFLNWTLNDLGTFDYAANAWGYTEGLAVEWYRGRWTARAGYFALSTEPNGTRIDRGFARQFQVDGELEERHTLWDRPGALRLMGFLSHGRMGLFRDAIALAQSTGKPADISLVRHIHERVGIGINLEQELADGLGVFLRAGYDDPSRESFEFTDVDASVSAGVSLKGDRWQRSDDTVGLAFIVNGISSEHAAFFDAGGLGILVGDGKLPQPGYEKIIEAYYDFATTKWLKLSADYQYVDNPAYNRDRGPVSILGTRLHAEF